MTNEILVCDCGMVIYKGKEVGKINLGVEWFANRNNGIVPLVFKRDSCVNDTDD